MKFTRNDSIKEILKYPLIKEYLPVFFPIFYLTMIPKEMEECCLNEIEEKVMMPWGGKFRADELIEAANTIVSILEKGEYRLFPLWEAEYESYRPKIAEITNKESVYMFTANFSECDKKSSHQ